jgi:DNA-binding transcriptional regulator GbsR (MarR family)
MPLSPTRLEMIEVTARTCQMVGRPRSTGQIYGLLYLAPRALGLEEIAEQLGISKASASTGTRHLLGWHAVRQVWKPGDRRPYYEVQADLTEVLRANYAGFFRPKLENSQRKLSLLLAGLEQDRKAGSLEREEYQICKDRLEALGRLQSRLQKLLPLAEKLL